MNKFVEAVFPGRNEGKAEENIQDLDLIDDDSLSLYVKGDGVKPDTGLHRAPCCSPVPGDRIIGLQYPGHGIIIHTIDCDELAGKEEQVDEWVDLAWRRAASQAASIGRLVITCLLYTSPSPRDRG